MSIAPDLVVERPQSGGGAFFAVRAKTHRGEFWLALNSDRYGPHDRELVIIGPSSLPVVLVRAREDGLVVAEKETP